MFKRLILSFFVGIAFVGKSNLAFSYCTVINETFTSLDQTELYVVTLSDEYWVVNRRDELEFRTHLLLTEEAFQNFRPVSQNETGYRASCDNQGVIVSIENNQIIYRFFVPGSHVFYRGLEYPFLSENFRPYILNLPPTPTSQQFIPVTRPHHPIVRSVSEPNSSIDTVSPSLSDESGVPKPDSSENIIMLDRNTDAETKRRKPSAPKKKHPWQIFHMNGPIHDGSSPTFAPEDSSVIKFSVKPKKPAAAKSRKPKAPESQTGMEKP